MTYILMMRYSEEIAFYQGQRKEKNNIMLTMDRLVGIVCVCVHRVSPF